MYDLLTFLEHLGCLGAWACEFKKLKRFLEFVAKMSADNFSRGRPGGLWTVFGDSILWHRTNASLKFANKYKSFYLIIDSNHVRYAFPQ